KKIDVAYVNWGTPPGNANPIGSAGPPLVELPTPASQRAAQLMGAIEGASTAPTDYEMAQLEFLSKKLPPLVEEVRKLVNEDLAAINNMMNDAKIPHIQPPAGAGGGRGRRGGDDNEDNDDDDPGMDNR